VDAELAAVAGTSGRALPPPPAAAPSRNGGGATDAGGDDFVASADFAGARPGFVFQSGPRGVGYYREGANAAAAAAGDVEGTPSAAASGARHSHMPSVLRMQPLLWFFCP